MRMKSFTVLSLGLLLAVRLVHTAALESAIVPGNGIRLEFDSRMRSRVVATFAGEKALGPFEDSETLLTAAGALGDFALESKRRSAGEGRARRRSPRHPDRPRRPHREARRGDGLRRARRAGCSCASATPTKATRRSRTLAGPAIATCSTPSAGPTEPAFWSYQSGSYEKRPDWVLPLPAGFTQQNFLGMNDSDYGGGTPVLDVWRRDVGLAVGHVELLPKLVSLPVTTAAGRKRRARGQREAPHSLKPGESLDTLRTFVAVHRGDHFDTLRAYSETMQAQGVSLPQAPKDAFEPDLVRLGLRARLHPEAGVRDAARGAATRLPLGGSRRRLAGGGRRLGARARPSSPPAMPT